MASVRRAPSIDVLCPLPDRQPIVTVPFEAGMTVERAVERSGLLDAIPATNDLRFGVWGVEVQPDYSLKPGDRVELSRPLLADPRDMRREFLADGRVMGGSRSRD